MNKLEIISALKTEANISKSDATRVVQIFFDSMQDALVREEGLNSRAEQLFCKKVQGIYRQKSKDR